MTNDLVAKWEISRRRVLAGMGAAGASLAANTAFAQATGPWATRPKGKVDRLNQGAERPPAAHRLDNPADCHGGPDQRDHGQNAALAARLLGPSRPVQLALEMRNRAPGEHDRMRQKAKYHRQVAEQRIKRQTGEQQQQRIIQGRRPHRGGNFFPRTALINRGATNDQ